MKKLFVFAASAALLMGLVACNKNIAGPEMPEFPVMDGYTDLTVRLDNPATKVAAQSATNEKAIQNVQIFVFRAGSGADAGQLDINGSAGFDTPINETSGTYSGLTVRATSGLREVWVIVNDSEDRTLGNIATKTDFLAATHDLSSSAAAKFVMIGHSDDGTSAHAPAITLSPGTQAVAVSVHRLAAAIVLRSVKNEFTSPAFRDNGDFKLVEAYLLNAQGRMNFGETRDPSTDTAGDYWYGKLAKETDAAKKALIWDDLRTSGNATDLNYNQTYSTTHSFYSYANPCAASEVITGWTPRAAVFVLETVLEGTTYYYPVILDTNPLMANKKYYVDLVIHRPGSTDPNIPVKFTDATAQITVEDWVDGDTYTPEM